MKAIRGWIDFVLYPLFVLQDIRRAQRKEQVLAEAFGPQYQSYRSRTWF